MNIRKFFFHRKLIYFEQVRSIKKRKSLLKTSEKTESGTVTHVYYFHPYTCQLFVCETETVYFMLALLQSNGSYILHSYIKKKTSTFQRFC